LIVIAEHRAQLEVLAKPLGARLYAETPTLIVARIHTYWEVWRRAGCP